MTVFTKADARRLLSEDGTSCTIPDTFTSVGDKAFYNNEFNSLQTVIIPDSITSVGDRAFRYCDALTNIKLPKSILSFGEYAFASCRALVSITLPKKLTSCGDNCFNGCSSLISVEIPSSLTTIPWRMFSGCSSLTSITIPSSVNKVVGCAFVGCSSLKSITIPDAVINNPKFGLNQITGDYCDPFYRCNELIALAQPFNMTVVEYLRHLLALKEERICFRVVLLTCLEVYQKMEEAASAELESERTKLIVGGESGSSSNNVRSIEITAEMKEGLSPQALSIINMLESKIEASDSKIGVLNSRNGVLTSKNASFTKENKELKAENKELKEEKLNGKEKVKAKVPSVAKKIDRNEMHLNGPLAYRMITAFELWREIALFL